MGHGLVRSCCQECPAEVHKEEVLTEEWETDWKVGNHLIDDEDPKRVANLGRSETTKAQFGDDDDERGLNGIHLQGLDDEDKEEADESSSEPEDTSDEEPDSPQENGSGPGSEDNLENNTDRIKRETAKLTANVQTPLLPIAQFSIAIYYAEPNEGFMTLDICKLGNPYAECWVDYATGPSPFENVKYKPVSGRVHFTSGVATIPIQIPIIQNQTFDATREFSLSLSNPEGCGLGLYLKNCRVKILSREVFPTPKYEKETREDYSTATWQDGKAFTMLTECSKYLYATNPGDQILLTQS
jgi:hypothetical protein